VLNGLIRRLCRQVGLRKGIAGLVFGWARHRNK
jgi:hypothetical protein